MRAGDAGDAPRAGGDAAACRAGGGELSLAECARILGMGEAETWEICCHFGYRIDAGTGEVFWPMSDIGAMAALAQAPGRAPNETVSDRRKPAVGRDGDERQRDGWSLG